MPGEWHRKESSMGSAWAELTGQVEETQGKRTTNAVLRLREGRCSQLKQGYCGGLNENGPRCAYVSNVWALVAGTVGKD